MPAVSWPSEASFSVCTSRSCAVRRSSSERDSSRVRACTSRTAARSRSRSPPGRRRSSTSSICLSVNGRTSVRVKREHADRHALPQHRHAQDRAIAAELLELRCQRVFRVGEHVGNVDDPRPRAATRPVTDAATRARRDRLLTIASELGQNAVVAPTSVEVAVALPDDGALVGVAQLGGRFRPACRSTGLQVEGRAADDLQHVGGRGLLLQRLAQFRGARLHLVEQADILDGDHRLVGEGLDQLDLLVVKGLGSRPASWRRRRSDSPSRSSGTPARCVCRPASATAAMRVFGVGQNVGDVDDRRSSTARPTADAAARLRSDWPRHSARKLGGKPIDRDVPEAAVDRAAEMRPCRRGTVGPRTSISVSSTSAGRRPSG